MANYVDGLDQVAHALGHPGRRQLITRLSSATATSSELAELLEIGLPALHKHAAVLHAAGLIASTKSGRVVTHSLLTPGLDEYADWLRARRLFWTNQFDALSEHLEGP